MRRTFRRQSFRAACLIAAGAWLAAGAMTRTAAQQKPAAESTALEVIQVRPQFYVIAGAGSNVAVQLGPDGAVVVDTGSADKADHVVAEIRKLTRQPIRYIINTSAEPDHVGGNDKVSAAGQSVIPTGGLNEIGAAGGRAPILAEENVQSRMTAPTGEKSAFPFGSWPTVTYSSALEEAQKDLYFNGEAVITMYQPEAHSDGDSIVFFRRSDVLVVGDVFDQTRFPVIDLEKGGSLQGIIDSLNRIIQITVPPVPLTWQEGGTLVVPGHGLLSHEADVVDYRDMVTIVRDRIQDLIAKGMTLEQVKKADPVKGFRRRYGSNTGAWTTDRFIEAAYRSLGGK
ncbi:MAG TPA: MBL fold metallo-hydrolase [Vicinamibacterales bacterium]|nr:MBL fold metallo-hydrolase [Vicinamibacterales bacterium]